MQLQIALFVTFQQNLEFQFSSKKRLVNSGMWWCCLPNSCVAKALDVFVFAGNVHLGRLLSKPVRAQESARNQLEKVDLGSFHVDTKKKLRICKPKWSNRWSNYACFKPQGHNVAAFVIHPVSLHDKKCIIFLRNDALRCNFNLQHPIVGWSQQKTFATFEHCGYTKSWTQIQIQPTKWTQTT